MPKTPKLLKRTFHEVKYKSYLDKLLEQNLPVEEGVQKLMEYQRRLARLRALQARQSSKSAPWVEIPVVFESSLDSSDLRSCKSPVSTGGSDTSPYTTRFGRQVKRKYETSLLSRAEEDEDTNSDFASEIGNAVALKITDPLDECQKNKSRFKSQTNIVNDDDLFDELLKTDVTVKGTSQERSKRTPVHQSYSRIPNQSPMNSGNKKLNNSNELKIEIVPSGKPTPRKRLRNSDDEAFDLAIQDFENENLGTEPSLVRKVVTPPSRLIKKEKGAKRTNKAKQDLNKFTIEKSKLASTVSDVFNYHNNKVNKAAHEETSSSFQEKVECPMCYKWFSQDDVNEHAATCEGEEQRPPPQQDPLHTPLEGGVITCNSCDKIFVERMEFAKHLKNNCITYN